MAYALRYHPRVSSDDLAKIPQATRDRIAQRIEDRLVVEPERYGAPLTGTLRGYRKLRVGDYRVVFRIVAKEVRILAILHRKDAYDRAARRQAM